MVGLTGRIELESFEKHYHHHEPYHHHHYHHPPHAAVAAAPLPTHASAASAPLPPPPPPAMAHHGLVPSQSQLSPIVDSPIAMDLTNELWLHANGHHLGTSPDFDSAYHNIKEGIGEQVDGFEGLLPMGPYYIIFIYTALQIL